MSKPVRILLIILAVDILAVGVYFLVKSAGSGKGGDPTKGYEWVTMDAYYQPASELEEYIKTTSDEQGFLPLQFRNYGQNGAVLKKFRGAKLVGAGKSVLEMLCTGCTGSYNLYTDILSIHSYALPERRWRAQLEICTWDTSILPNENIPRATLHWLLDGEGL